MGAVALNIVLNLTLVQVLGYRGLALGTSIAAVANAVTLLALLRRRLDGLDLPRVFLMLAKMTVASAAMGLAAWWLHGWLAETWEGVSLLVRLVRVTASIVAGVAVLFVTARALRNPGARSRHRAGGGAPAVARPDARVRRRLLASVSRFILGRGSRMWASDDVRKIIRRDSRKNGFWIGAGIGIAAAMGICQLDNLFPCATCEGEPFHPWNAGLGPWHRWSRWVHRRWEDEGDPIRATPDLSAWPCLPQCRRQRGWVHELLWRGDVGRR